MEQRIDLSGSWSCCIDEDDIGLQEKWYQEDFSKRTDSCSFALPGSTCDNQIGKKQDWYDSICKESIRAPREKYEYVGVIWLQRQFSVTVEELEHKEVSLFLERVNLSSMLFVDGEQVGREIVGLSTPHVYELSGRLFQLTPGEHTLTLRLDNRDHLHRGNMASGYSVDTMGYWNGVIGRLELRIEPDVRIEDIQVFPSKKELNISVITKSNQHVPLGVVPASLAVTVILNNGERLHTQEKQIELYTTRQRERISYQFTEEEMSKVCEWNEFHPELVTLEVELIGEKKVSKQISFGIRTVKTENKRFYINDKTFALRGTINCAQFPITGYPPMDEEYWTEYMKTMRSWGLNHIRFHAWCPPEAAFTAADKVGMYLQVEMPLWLNRDATVHELGDDMGHYDHYSREARQIRSWYGNHPSFVMFSNGNENIGDFAFLEDCIEQLKAQDRRCLYTITSNFDHPVHPSEDYISAFEMAHQAARIQFLHDEVGISNTVNYEDIVSKLPVPAVSFEVGQYCVYPDVDCVEKYTGAMMPVNFDVIRKEMKEKKVYHRLKDYIEASGDLSVKLYKEDIEAALRTKGFGGIQLLSISDYTGQSTATVGILDAFIEDKKIVSQAEWRGFCSEVVPLFEAKRMYRSDETMNALLSLYDYGETRLDEAAFLMRIMDGDLVWKELQVSYKQGEKSEVCVSFTEVTEPKLFRLRVSVDGNHTTYTNEWRIFVYPKQENQELPIDWKTNGFKGKNNKKLVSVEYLSEKLKRKMVPTNFIPVFWSPVHFPSDASCGAIISTGHEALFGFPTEKYPDYQWKSLLEKGTAMDIADLDCKPVVEMVPNFVTNIQVAPLFEMELEGEQLLVCGFDLDAEDIATKAFRKSILEYLG